MGSNRRPPRRLSARLRQIRIVSRAALDQDRPLLAQVIAMRRCNLACAYCNEYDQHSPPVPSELMFERIRHLTRLGAAVVTISGGEPLLHPNLDAFIRQIHDSGMVSTIITNGFKLGADRIRSLNAARLDHLQISIDNVRPDAVSSKSLSVLDRKLTALAELAEFTVNINCVVGAGVDNPEDALVIARRARELGFTSTMGIIHDGHGQLRPLTGRAREVYDAFEALTGWSLTRFNRSFQRNLAEGRPNQWRCRAGSRYLYICESGLVHYCSQRRGAPAIPLAQYTRAHIRKAHTEEKPCAPFCTLPCVHQASTADRWRSPQHQPDENHGDHFGGGAPEVALANAADSASSSAPVHDDRASHLSKSPPAGAALGEFVGPATPTPRTPRIWSSPRYAAASRRLRAAASIDERSGLVTA